MNNFMEVVVGGGCPRCGTRNHNHAEDCPYNHKNQFDEITNMLRNQNQVIKLQGDYQKDRIYFSKIKPNAIIPSKRDEDGCYDIYACYEGDELILYPNKPTLIDTGIASAFSKKYRFNCKRERGSTGIIAMNILSGQIDSGYRGSWFINIINILNKPIIISKLVNKTEERNDYILYPASKGICQAALEFVPEVDIEEIPYEELLNLESERGVGKIGSSGK